ASARSHAHLRIAEGRAPGGTDAASLLTDRSQFLDYIGFRREHPSVDLMTDLITLTVVDDRGSERALDEEEIINYAMLLAAAGNETTARLIGWTGYLLAKESQPRAPLAEEPRPLSRADAG